MKTDIILCGVGGQGILSIATVIGQAAMNENLYIKQAEVHGMSQRGGDVQSNLRLSSDPINSDRIAKGQADVIISMEPMEALRYLPYLKKGGWIILGGKGSTEFGIGASIAEVIRAVFGDENRVLPVSVYLDGQYGQHGVYASVPCILGAAGVEEVIELTLSRDEAEGFAKSCAIIREHCEKL